MKTISKRIIMLYVILAVVSMATVTAIIIGSRLAVIRKQYVDIDRYESECNAAAMWIGENLPNGRYIISYDGSAYKLGLFNISAEVSKTIEVIDGTFSNAEYLDFIEVNGSRVIFWAFGKDHALVYSPNGMPWKVGNHFTLVVRICDNWYHMTRN